MGHGGAVSHLPGHLVAAGGTAKSVGSAAQGAGVSAAILRRRDAGPAHPGERTAADAVCGCGSPWRTLAHAGQAEPEVRTHDAALCRHAARTRLGTHADRV